MRFLTYYSGGQRRRIRVQNVAEPPPGPALAMAGRPGTEHRVGADLVAALARQRPQLESTSFHQVAESHTFFANAQKRDARLIPTESIIVDGAEKSEIDWVRQSRGFEVVDEGEDRVLLRAPHDDRADGFAGVAEAARVSRELVERGVVGAAHPHFLRAVERLPRPNVAAGGAALGGQQWALENSAPNGVGVVGADVDAHAAWAITEGVRDVRVAVLDEGVDSGHPDLSSAIDAERDFVGGRPDGRPVGDDAHGTACAGIVVSQNPTARGLAPGVGLVSARIAEGDGQGRWAIFADWSTVDAIDWCWRDVHADVLSNSWTGGWDVDAIGNAITRARTQGRGGLGAVVVFSAGNHQVSIPFPGTETGVLTVGASNQWDQRKTKSSRDGENWWGSNHGDALDVLAPGVAIPTTDIRGPRGYGPDDLTVFNGTSAAAPHAAAVAALLFSIRPDLTEAEVRQRIIAACDPVVGGSDPRLVGGGRLNAHRSLL